MAGTKGPSEFHGFSYKKDHNLVPSMNSGETLITPRLRKTLHMANYRRQIQAPFLCQSQLSVCTGSHGKLRKVDVT